MNQDNIQAPPRPENPSGSRSSSLNYLDDLTDNMSYEDMLRTAQEKIIDQQRLLAHFRQRLENTETANVSLRERETQLIRHILASNPQPGVLQMSDQQLQLILDVVREVATHGVAVPLGPNQPNGIANELHGLVEKIAETNEAFLQKFRTDMLSGFSDLTKSLANFGLLQTQAHPLAQLAGNNMHLQNEVPVPSGSGVVRQPPRMNLTRSGVENKPATNGVTANNNNELRSVGSVAIDENHIPTLNLPPPENIVTSENSELRIESGSHVQLDNGPIQNTPTSRPKAGKNRSPKCPKSHRMSDPVEQAAGTTPRSPKRPRSQDPEDFVLCERKASLRSYSSVSSHTSQ